MKEYLEQNSNLTTVELIRTWKKYGLVEILAYHGQNL